MPLAADDVHRAPPTKTRSRARSALPPGPAGSLLLGSLLPLARDPLAFLLALGHEYGPVSYARFGPVSMYMLNDPQLVEEVLVGKHRECIKDKSTRDLAPLVGQGLITSEGEHWRRQRKLASAPLQPKRIQSYAAVVSACCESLIADVRDAEERDIHADLMRLTLEIVGKTMLGVDTRDDAQRVGHVLDVFMRYFEQQLFSWQGLLPLAIPTPTRLRMRRAVADLDAIVYPMIARCRTEGPGADHLLSRLVHAPSDQGEAMSDAQLRDEAVTMLLAGHETTALALTYAVFALSQHPAAAARLRDEVDQMFARGASAAQLCELPYLDAFVRETLRLYPPAYVIGREATQSFEAGGYTLPQGSQIAFSPYALQRDARFFPAPERFDPDRWLDANAAKLPRFAYFPFGGGPRICIGMHFAMMEIAIVLGLLAHHLELPLLSSSRLEIHPVATLRVRGGLSVRVRRRTRGGG